MQKVKLHFCNLVLRFVQHRQSIRKFWKWCIKKYTPHVASWAETHTQAKAVTFANGKENGKTSTANRLQTQRLGSPAGRKSTKQSQVFQRKGGWVFTAKRTHTQGKTQTRSRLPKRWTHPTRIKKIVIALAGWTEQTKRLQNGSKISALSAQKGHF